jgi:hypothetical protein
MKVDCRVFRGLEIKSDHFMLAVSARLQPRWYKKQTIAKNKNNEF